MILNTAKMTRVRSMNPINTKHAVLVTDSAILFSPSSISGTGRGVGVVGGGTVVKFKIYITILNVIK